MEYLACTDWYIESAVFVIGKNYTFIEIYIQSLCCSALFGLIAQNFGPMKMQILLFFSNQALVNITFWFFKKKLDK